MSPTTQSNNTVLTFSTRKPGLTFSEYKTYYETQHAPFVENLILRGADAPLSYTRHYIERDSDAPRSFPFGGAEGWEYDCVAVSVFRDQEHRDRVLGAFAEHREVIAQDEAKFLDVEKLRIVFVTEKVASVFE